MLGLLGKECPSSPPLVCSIKDSSDFQLGGVSRIQRPRMSKHDLSLSKINYSITYCFSLKQSRIVWNDQHILFTKIAQNGILEHVYKINILDICYSSIFNWSKDQLQIRFCNQERDMDPEFMFPWFQGIIVYMYEKIITLALITLIKQIQVLEK